MNNDKSSWHALATFDSSLIACYAMLNSSSLLCGCPDPMNNARNKARNAFAIMHALAQQLRAFNKHLSFLNMGRPGHSAARHGAEQYQPQGRGFDIGLSALYTLSGRKRRPSWRVIDDIGLAWTTSMGSSPSDSCYPCV